MNDRDQAPRKVTPITDLIALVDRYSEEEWLHAAYMAASNEVDEVCTLLAQITSDRTNGVRR